MKSKFAHALDLVRANDGFPGLGFKRAAAEANVERTLMRFALEAWRQPEVARAIEHGVIADPKVVQLFHRLPRVGVDIVCRLEARLGRTMSRSRAERLVSAYLKVTGREDGAVRTHLPPAQAEAIRPGVQSGRGNKEKSPRFRLPSLPAIF